VHRVRDAVTARAALHNERRRSPRERSRTFKRKARDLRRQFAPSAAEVAERRRARSLLRMRARSLLHASSAEPPAAFAVAASSGVDQVTRDGHDADKEADDDDDFEDAAARCTIHSHAGDEEWPGPHLPPARLANFGLAHRVPVAVARALPPLLARDMRNAGRQPRSPRGAGGSPLAPAGRARDLLGADGAVPDLHVLGEPVEGAAPDVIPMTRHESRCQGTLPLVTRHHSLPGMFTTHAAPIALPSSVASARGADVTRLGIETPPWLVPAPATGHRHPAPAHKPRAAFVVATQAPSPTSATPTASPALRSLTARRAEAALAPLSVSRDTCGTRQTFLYRLGDVGRA
jgi:hypothetical protein